MHRLAESGASQVPSDRVGGPRANAVRFVMVFTTALTIVLPGLGTFAVAAHEPMERSNRRDTVKLFDGARPECHRAPAIPTTVPSKEPGAATIVTFVILPTVRLTVRGDTFDFTTNTGIDPCRSDAILICQPAGECRPAPPRIVEKFFDHRDSRSVGS